MGQPERAARLFGATGALLKSVGAWLDPVDRAMYDRNIAAVRTQLEPAAFQAAWDAGAGLPFPAVLALASELPPPAGAAAPLRPARPAPPAGAHTAPTNPDTLTPREAEVLRLVAAGLTDAEVAARLYLSPRTVQTHLRSIYSKLDLTTRSAATRYAIEHHFV